MNSRHRIQGSSSILSSRVPRWNGRSANRFFAGLVAMTTAVVLGVVVGPAAGPAFGSGGAPSTITISKQTLRGSNAKIVGTSFELRPYTAGQTTPPAHTAGDPTCTIASGTSCQVVVPNTGNGEANHNKQYWVVETSAPSGTSAISSLGTGDVSTVVRANPYPGVTPKLSSSTVNIPSDAYQLVGDSTSSTSLEQSNSGSVVVNRLDDPALSVSCNSDLDIALVLDKSSSINGAGVDYRSSYATGVGQLLDALGTSSHTKVAAFTFNTNAAKLVSLGTPSANKSTIVNNINGNSYAAATNWDAGFQAVSDDSDIGKYDVVIMVTDGAPNTYGNNVYAGGVEFRAMEEAVLSANALKNAGKQILAVGVGGINNKPAEGKLNLAAISDESHDFIGDWADLGTQLANIAKNLTCQGTVTVNKTTVNDRNHHAERDRVGLHGRQHRRQGLDLRRRHPDDHRPEAVGFVDLPVRQQGRHHHGEPQGDQPARLAADRHRVRRQGCLREGGRQLRRPGDQRHEHQLHGDQHLRPR